MARYRSIVALATAAAFVVFAAPAQGAVTFGSSLVPTNQTVSCPNNAAYCTYVQDTLPLGDNLVEAPANGVVVRWRLRAPITGGPVNFRIVRRTQAGLLTQYKSLASQPFQVPASGVDEILSFNTQLPVKTGDRIGIDKPGSMTGLFHTQQIGGGSSSAFIPQLQNNVVRFRTNTHDAQLVVNADIEPDAEGDGFGDETQDSCPPGKLCSDKSAPVLSGLKLSPKTFRVNRSATKPKASKAPKGSLFAYSASEVSQVTFSFGRKVRKPRGRGVKLKPAGSFTQAATAGQNVKDFSGLVGKRYLKPGRYTAKLVARDGAGNASKPVTTGLRIVKR